jgi:hypothetical protein
MLSSKKLPSPITFKYKIRWEKCSGIWITSSIRTAVVWIDAEDGSVTISTSVYSIVKERFPSFGDAAPRLKQLLDEQYRRDK